MSVNVYQIVVSGKFKHCGEGYQEGEIIKPLCIILPQMSGYIKYFENGGKNTSFLLKIMKCKKNTKTFGIWLKTN